MAGFDKDKARTELNVPAGSVEAMVSSSASWRQVHPAGRPASPRSPQPARTAVEAGIRRQIQGVSLTVKYFAIL
jgi:hypothetical protein